jgi:hypothetical protein
MELIMSPCLFFIYMSDEKRDNTYLIDKCELLFFEKVKQPRKLKIHAHALVSQSLVLSCLRAVSFSAYVTILK